MPSCSSKRRDVCQCADMVPLVRSPSELRKASFNQKYRAKLQISAKKVVVDNEKVKSVRKSNGNSDPNKKVSPRKNVRAKVNSFRKPPPKIIRSVSCPEEITKPEFKIGGEISNSLAVIDEENDEKLDINGDDLEEVKDCVRICESLISEFDNTGKMALAIAVAPRLMANNNNLFAYP